MHTRLQVPVLLAVVLALAACKSSGGTDAASSTVNDLKTLQKELAKGEHSIDAAVAALTDLTTEGGDMTAEYQRYCKAVDAVAAQRARVQSVQAELAEQRQAFTASWDASLVRIQNASMKERATERRDKVVDAFDELKASGDETRTAVDEWFGDLVDLRTYLEHDLNPSGIESVESDAKSIVKRAGKINEALAEYVSELGELVEQLEATKPEPAPAQAGA